MIPFVFENPPLVESQENRNLSEYLQRMMFNLAQTTESVHEHDESVPFRGDPREGMLKFTSIGGDPFNYGPGLYVFHSGEWFKLAEVATSVYAAYGGLFQSSAPIGQDIGLGWTPVPFDSDAPSAAGAVIPDHVNNTITIVLGNVYLVNMSFSITHDTRNAGRNTFLRIVDLDDNIQVSRPFPVPIGRDQPGTSFSYTSIFQTGADMLGHRLQLQVGGDDDVSLVVWDHVDWTFTHVSSPIV